MTARSKHYFKRMGLFEFLKLDSEMKIKEHDSSGRFIPLTQITDSESLNRFLTEMTPMLHKDPEQVAPIRYIMSELIRNVIEHSGSWHGAMVCAQLYPKSKKVRIGVVDCGIGIKRSINHSYPEATNDLKALTLALTPGITGTTRKIGGTEYNGGAGLFIVKSIAKLNRDFFLVYTGDTMYKLLQDNSIRNERLNKDPLDDKHKITENLPYWQGTVAAIDLSTDKEMNFTELFTLIKQAYRSEVREQIKIKYKKPRFTQHGN